jgi:hypothetical protein
MTYFSRYWTFLKICPILDVKFRLDIFNVDKKTLKSKPYIVSILSLTVDDT